MRGSCIVSQPRIAIISIFSTNSGNGLLNENFFLHIEISRFVWFIKTFDWVKDQFIETSESKHLLETPGSSIQLRTM